MPVKNFALIVPAAGIGKRMGKDVPKPYLTLSDKTVLEHTLSRFRSFDNLAQVIVSTSREYRSTTESILVKLFPNIDTLVVDGGSERQDSILNALESVDDNISLVAVHDAVRPFVDPISIRECLKRASETGAAILGVVVKDTIKQVNSDLNVISTPQRKSLWQAQTPQIFNRKVLVDAYLNANKAGFSGTDDASLVEENGGEVSIVEGTRNNFKLTYPLDFEIAKTLLKKG